MKLTMLGSKSVIAKPVTLNSVSVPVEIKVNRSSRVQEMEIITEKKKMMGETPPPFKTMEELHADKGGPSQSALSARSGASSASAASTRKPAPSP